MKHSLITNSILFLCAIMAFIAPSIASAQTTPTTPTTPITTTTSSSSSPSSSGFGTLVKGICNVVEAAQKGPVKALLVIIVLFMGVGAFFGKVNWGLIVQTIVGISAALGAGAIAKIITGVDCELADMGIPNAPGFGDPRTCEGVGGNEGNQSNECFPKPF